MVATGPLRRGLPAAMPLPALHRLLSSFLPSMAQDGPGRPPQLQRRAPGWLVRLGFEDARNADLASARLDFADALADLHRPGAVDARSRIAVARSLYDLWHLREEVFSLVACRHDQAEAARRLARLDKHFGGRTDRATLRERSAGHRSAAGG
jgi:hypothetical protein